MLKSTKYNYKVSKEDKEKSVELYKKGMTSIELGRLYSVDQSTVRGWLKTRGVKGRNPSECMRKHYNTTTNESAFEDLNDENVAYWVGFLAADGAIFKNTVAIVLNKKDKKHCLKFSEFIKSSQKVLDVGDKVRVACNSPVLVEKLSYFGVGERKSFSALAPDCFKNSKHFWRGVVDGDGHIGFRKGMPHLPKLELCGSFLMMNQFINYVKTFVDTKASVTKMRSIFRVQLTGKIAEKVIIELYKDSSVSLDRKHEIARGIFIKSVREAFPELCEIKPSALSAVA